MGFLIRSFLFFCRRDITGGRMNLSRRGFCFEKIFEGVVLVVVSVRFEFRVGFSCLLFVWKGG